MSLRHIIPQRRKRQACRCNSVLRHPNTLTITLSPEEWYHWHAALQIMTPIVDQFKKLPLVAMLDADSIAAAQLCDAPLSRSHSTPSGLN